MDGSEWARVRFVAGKRGGESVVLGLERWKELRKPRYSELRDICCKCLDLRNGGGTGEIGIGIVDKHVVGWWWLSRWCEAQLAKVMVNLLAEFGLWW